MASSQRVCVETNTENAIIEVTYDGQEIIQAPLTLAEHLTQQANKIDFETLEDDEEGSALDGGGGGGDDETDDDGSDSAMSGTGDDSDEEDGSGEKSVWPWETVRNKLRDALTEISVLSDVIAIATKDAGPNKRYMVLDGPVQADIPEPRPYVSLLAKKKGLDLPARILLQGAEHLKSLQSTISSNNSTSNNEFHVELLRLRQNWRLKKVSNTILGDLSYRTAGSQYKQSGVFEVTKAAAAPSASLKEDEEEKKSILPPVGSVQAQQAQQAGFSATEKTEPPKVRSALNVIVPSELQGIAYIQVTIQKESEQILSASLSNFGVSGNSSDNSGAAATAAAKKNPPEVHWQQKLEQAQNVLFCKELFAHLAKEAIQLQAPIPHMVVGNQITASLFTDIQLTITLCHSTGNEKKKSAAAIAAAASEAKNGKEESSSAQNQQPPSHRDHSHVLEHSLHQLLRIMHKENINPEDPCLSSAPVGVSKKRRFAGPMAADRYTLLEMAKSETILERIIAQAQHVVLRLRTMYVLDTMARDLKDPLITCHWSTLSSPTSTSVKVLIMTAGYDTILRTQLVIRVEEKRLTVVCRDGRVLHFSHEPQELRDFILCQISHHQINGVQALAKVTGWQVLSSSNCLGCGPVEPLGNAAGALLASPSGDRFIAVRHSPTSQTSVFISTAPCKDFFPGAVVKNVRKWENLPESFQEVRLDRMDGKNLLSKLELLMAALSSSSGSSS